MIAALALAFALQGGGIDRAPSVSVRVAPESPAVGEPISVELRVRAPVGTLVRFPVLPDTGTRIEPLDPRQVTGTEQDGWVEQVARYRLIAWDTGSVAVAFGDVTLERDGRSVRYPVQAAELRIRSILPPDTAARTPRPARDPVDALQWPWRWMLAAALIVALALWGWWRRRRGGQVTAAPALDAIGPARAGFAQLQRLDLASIGEPGQHLLAHVAVLRRYLAARWPSLPTALTAQELTERLAALDFPVLPERVTDVVSAAEPVAYARAALSAERATELAAACVAVVEDLEQAHRAREARVAEASRVKRKRLR